GLKPSWMISRGPSKANSKPAGASRAQRRMVPGPGTARFVSWISTNRYSLKYRVAGTANPAQPTVNITARTLTQAARRTQGWSADFPWVFTGQHGFSGLAGSQGSSKEALALQKCESDGESRKQPIREVTPEAKWCSRIKP